ncbi:MAG: HDOD domain-containing protein [Planctomycetota bacterium]
MRSPAIEKLERQILRAGGLPVFHKSLEEILDRIRHDAPLPAIAQAIEKDPSLTSRVLRLANSAYYGMSREVSTLKMAMVLLGVRAVRNLVLSIGMVEILEDDPDGAYIPTDFLMHCQYAGRAASYLSRLHGLPFAGEDFVVGLVHDVGKLVLLRAFPEEAAAASDQLGGLRGAELMSVEDEVFGVDHAEAGAWAVGQWHLPSEISLAIADHHRDGIHVSPLAALAQAADLLAHFHADSPSDALPETWAESPLLSHPALDRDGLTEALEAEDHERPTH